MSNFHEIDYTEAKKLLNHICGDNHTLQTFSDNKQVAKATDTDRSAKLFYNSDAATMLKLAQLNKKGAGCYFMVNSGDGKGRRNENVTRINALFLDLDGSPLEPVLESGLKPHAIVETSAGRYHVYWKVSDCQLSEFKKLQQAIAARFNGDKSVNDLARVMRLPGFYHNKGTPFLARIIELNELSTYTVDTVIEGLGLNIAELKQQTANQANEPSSLFEYTDRNTGEVIDLVAWATKNPHFDIVKALNTQYARGSIKDGKQHIQCPFEHEHTVASTDMATFIANTSPPQYTSWNIHCMHSHCAGRDRLEFLSAMLEKGYLSADILESTAPLEVRRPKKVYYHIDDVSSAMEWETLQADEFRIALHLMTFMWADISGTIVDDDWQIARRLRIPEGDWQEYRKTLVRSGWLIEEAGRLSNGIAKREYDNAQIALMDAIESGRKGGRATQKKRGYSSTPSSTP